MSRSSCLAANVLLITAFTIIAEAEEKRPKQERKLDRYGDPLPDGALMRLGAARLRQPMGCRCVALSPDGKLLVTGGHYSVRLWDAAMGKLLRDFPHGAESWVYLRKAGAA